MRISVICVGRVKEQYLRDAIAEYSKRLGRYCKLDIIEVADEKTPEHASEGVERQIRAKEGGRIAKHIRPDAYVIALAIDGTMLSSEGLAAHINQLGLHGESHIQLTIGGSIGLDDAILRRADYRLSFSKMTFPPDASITIADSALTRGQISSAKIPRVRRQTAMTAAPARDINL